MTQGQRLSPEIQQQVLTYLEMKKSIKWIMKRMKLSKRTIYRLRNAKCVKYKNDYKKKPGRPPKITHSEKIKIKRYIIKNNRAILDLTKSELKLPVCKQTLSRVFREIGISKKK